jgi:hypothetical protein
MDRMTHLKKVVVTPNPTWHHTHLAHSTTKCECYSVDQWIHCFVNSPHSLQLVNSFKIQWNHLAYRDTFCCSHIITKPLFNLWIFIYFKNLFAIDQNNFLNIITLKILQNVNGWVQLHYGKLLVSCANLPPLKAKSLFRVDKWDPCTTSVYSCYKSWLTPPLFTKMICCHLFHVK